MKDSITTSCRKNQTAILSALTKTGQGRVAELVGVSDSVISRWKDTDAERVSAILAASGLMVVEVGTPIVDMAYLNALRVLARPATDPDSGWGGL